MERRDQPHCDGSVTAGTLATAQAWAVAQRALLTGDKLGGSYPRQEEWETDYEFVPRIDGIPTGNTANVRLYRVNFTFAEILPLHPPPSGTPAANQVLLKARRERLVAQ